VFKVAVKSFFANKLRFLLTFFAVVLGVAFMSGTMVLTDTVERTFNDLFADINEGTDAVVRTRSDIEFFGTTQRDPVPAALVDRVESIEGVDYAVGMVNAYAQIVGTDGEPIGNPGQGAPTFGMEWIDSDELNPMVIREGRPPARDDEIVIDRGSAKNGDIDVGDVVKVQTVNETEDYKVVGIATFGTADSPAGASITMFTPREAQRVAQYDGEYDSVAVVADEGLTETEVQAILQQALADQPELEVLTGTQLTEENQDDIEEALSFFSTGLLIFAVVALIVGGFIIYNSFTIIVAQRAREMALLRAIGASTRQVTASVLLESVMLAVLASVAGLLAGVGLAVMLKELLGALGFDIPAGGAVVTATTVVVALGVGTVLTVACAALPARRASRVPPVAAMRDVAIERPPRLRRRLVIGGGISVIAIAVMLLGLFGDVENGIGLVGLGAFLLFIGIFVLSPTLSRPVARVLGAPLPAVKGMTGTLARENAMRNPKRTAATAAALMIGVSLVGFITIFAASVTETIESAIDEQVTTDLFITTGAGFGPGLSPTLAEQVADVPEVGVVTPIRFGAIAIGGNNDFVTGADPVAADTLFDFNVLEGDLRDLGPTDIAISERTAEDDDLRLGDQVPIEFSHTGQQLFTLRAIYERYEIADDYLISLDAYERNFKTQLDFQVFIEPAPGVTIDQARAALQPLVDEYPTAELQDSEEYKDNYVAQINQFLVLIYVLLLFAVIIALFGIANTLALSVYERTRELGLLRAVGMTRPQVRSAVRWEAVLISLFGTLLGLVVGVFFGWVIVEALRDEGFSEFAVPPGQMLAIVVVAALAGVVTAIYPARRAARLDVLRAIATE